MAPTLYYCDPSCPSRGALLTAHSVPAAKVALKSISLFNKEHLTPEFIKINPQHTVPVLTDGDLTICDSHVISTYLVEKYAPDDSLYPKDLKARTLVDQRLYFDAATLFPKIRGICFPVLFRGKTTVDADLKEGIHDGLSFLEKYLEGKPWVAGDKMTIADFACVASVTSVVELKFDMSKYPNVNAWLSRCEKEIPGYAEFNDKGAKQLGNAVLSKLQPNQI
ncbi:hypothetical protein L9F63_006529 [Diploptera punctata]|uniref:Uncharacterized protein n=1 Tax=Diploptera punctata TaxID=6984 RepID=A0AAD8E4W8_DIPPU|nr:hypothetical protein L9F63_006529 [Diploptera punctata]